MEDRTFFISLGAGTLKDSVSAFERDIIKKALEKTGGNQSAAARILGTTKRIIQYKVSKYGIDCEEFDSREVQTYMHLTYDNDDKDIHKGTRQKIIANALSAFKVEDRDGELFLRISENNYGDALYSFAQALLKIAGVSNLSRERGRSTFIDDFQELMTENIPEDLRAFDWSHPAHDPHGMFTVDCYVKGIDRPILIFALPDDDRVRDATTALHKFKKWGFSFLSLAIFEDQESISRKTLAGFSDVCDKQFSSLAAAKQRGISYLQDSMPR